MTKTTAIIIMVVTIIVAAFVGIIGGTYLNKYVFRTQRYSLKNIIFTIIGAALLIIIAVIIITFFPQFVHSYK